MTAINREALAAEPAALADHGHGLPDRPHERDSKVVRLDHRVDVAWRLDDMNLTRRVGGKTESLRDCGQNLRLSVA